jgi:hypothetical protein
MHRPRVGGGTPENVSSPSLDHQSSAPAAMSPIAPSAAKTSSMRGKRACGFGGACARLAFAFFRLLRLLRSRHLCHLEVSSPAASAERMSWSRFASLRSAPAFALLPLDRARTARGRRRARGARLRALAAIHLGAAADLSPLDAFVGYDERQSAAARLAGLRTVQPD